MNHEKDGDDDERFNLSGNETKQCFCCMFLAKENMNAFGANALPMLRLICDEAWP